VGIAAFVNLGYLFFQYSKFISPPSLSVSSPKDQEVIDKDFVLVEGRSDSDAKVIANNQPLITDQDGKFSVEIEVTTETKEVVVKAISRSGKETVISRKIEVR
jgi:hypothetical protein